MAERIQPSDENEKKEDGITSSDDSETYKDEKEEEDKEDSVFKKLSLSNPATPVSTSGQPLLDEDDMTGVEDAAGRVTRFTKICELLMGCFTCGVVFLCSNCCMQLAIFFPTLVLPEIILLIIFIICFLPCVLTQVWILWAVLMCLYLPISVPYAMLVTCVGAPILSLLVDISFRWGRWFCFCYCPCEEMGRVWGLDELPGEKSYGLFGMIWKKMKRLVKKLLNVCFLMLLLLISESRLFIAVLLSFIISTPSKNETYDIYEKHSDICPDLYDQGMSKRANPLMDMCADNGTYVAMRLVFLIGLFVGIVFTSFFIFVEISITSFCFRGFSSHRLKYIILFGSYKESLFRRCLHIFLFITLFMYAFSYWLVDWSLYYNNSISVYGRGSIPFGRNLTFTLPYLIFDYFVITEIFSLLTYDGESSIDYVKLFYFPKYKDLPDIHGNIFCLIFADPGQVLYQIQSTISLLSLDAYQRENREKENEKKKKKDDDSDSDSEEQKDEEKDEEDTYKTLEKRVEELSNTSRFGHMDWDYIDGLNDRELMILRSFFVEDYQGLKEDSFLNKCCFSSLWGTGCCGLGYCCTCLTFCLGVPIYRSFRDGLANLMVFWRYVQTQEDKEELVRSPLIAWNNFQDFFMEDSRSRTLEKLKLEPKKKNNSVNKSLSVNSRKKKMEEEMMKQADEGKQVELFSDENKVDDDDDSEEDERKSGKEEEGEEEEDGENYEEEEKSFGDKLIAFLPKKILVTTICCPRNCCCVFWVFMKLTCLFGVLVSREFLAFFGIVWGSLDGVGGGDAGEMCAKNITFVNFGQKYEDARSDYCEFDDDVYDQAVVYEVFRWTIIGGVLTMIFLDSLIKYVLLMAFMWNKLKFLIVYGIIREWVVYRVFMASSLIIAYLVCCGVMIIQNFTFGGVDFLLVSNFLFEFVAISVVFVLKTNEVITYDGPSSSAYYYSLVFKSLCTFGGCCFGPICFREFVLPDINAGWCSIAFGDPDSKLQQTITCLACIKNRRDMKMKKNNSKFAHFGWGLISNMNDHEIKLLQKFFFGEDLDSKQSHYSTLCYTSPQKCKFWKSCVCFNCCCVFCFCEGCFTGYCHKARMEIKRRILGGHKDDEENGEDPELEMGDTTN